MGALKVFVQILSIAFEPDQLLKVYLRNRIETAQYKPGPRFCSESKVQLLANASPGFFGKG